MDVFLSITSTTDGGVQEVRYSLSDSLVVGRGAEGGVLLEGPDLSREHLAFTSEGGSVYVTDLSVNGTWVNGKRLRKSVRQRVSPEDSIELPGYVLKYRSADQPELVEDAPSDQTSQLLAEDNPPAVAVAKKSGPLAVLQPLFGFVGSFSFMEKFLVMVGLTGLLLLYTYLGS
jgi:pSer/pThr/pTyr-binding forkhead associated (FHA) protein